MIEHYVGIDPGRLTGYACISRYDTYVTTWDLGEDPYPVRLHRLWLEMEYDWASGRARGRSLVCYEQPARMQGVAGQHIAGYLAVIQLECERLGIMSYPVNQQTLKAFARATSGHDGPMTKEAMISTAQAMGAKPDDDNQADAWWLAEYGRRVVIPAL